ncbi:34893_t:CDS:10 [Gigaspora margarita]|uniref:34893_t:CDS:1 n=1 Tax=Gigaspora margarita TaxID=4874 RepID=A0ABN7VJ86_GIGMA|nr:34893_t:CDS:10 [Gigaspora margarita]
MKAEQRHSLIEMDRKINANIFNYTKIRKIGYLKVITGPMFAGKTEELLRHIHRLQRAKKKYLVFKPQVDNRHTTSEVISHQNNKTNALIISSSQEIEKHLNNDMETIFIDEIQFFPPEIASFLCNLTQQGHQIIVAGLDKNFRGEPFNETIKSLLALADYVEKLTAICQVCQNEASFTQRIINSQPARYHDPLILVGGQETYEARCRSCYVIVAHVYYGYYFANKITGAVKRKVAKKLFRLQNPQDKKKTLSVLTHNVRAFSSLVVYVPNQLYYWLLDVSLVFVIPSYSLPKFAPFLFLRFINNNASFQAANNLVELAGSTKKMAERLRFYPFGLSAQKQINNFLAQPERNDRQKNVLVGEPVDTITLKKVSFAYQENKSVLKKLDLQFKKGKVNHLTGANGFAKIAYAEHENLIENGGGLSTGQKQLADLDNLFANSENKEVFIFDEADNALDENNKKEFRAKLDKIKVNKKTKAEKILEDIEAQLRKLITEKKELKKKFSDKLKELSKQEKENKEILQLERKIMAGVLPTEREEIMNEIKKLNNYNITLEQGFKKRKIDAEVVTEIRKRLEKQDRTGVGTKALFGCQMRFKLQEGFPLLTTKKVNFKAIVWELLWFIKGETNIKYLVDRESLAEFIEKIKNDNNFAQKYGDLGPVYVDQLKELVENLKNNPFSRPQFFVSEKNELSCLLYQRSGDMFLGVPFNIASYSLLTTMLAQVCGYRPGEFIQVIGDAHIYLNHLEQIQIQLSREPKKLPTLKLNQKVKSLFNFCYEDIILENYEPHPPIKGKDKEKNMKSFLQAKQEFDNNYSSQKEFTSFIPIHLKINDPFHSGLYQKDYIEHLIGVIEFKKGDLKDIETVYNQQLKPVIKESDKSFCLGILYDAERLYLFQKKNGNYSRLDETYNLKGEKSTTKDLCLHLTDAYYKIPSFEQLKKQVTKITFDRSKRTIDDLDIITGIYSKQLTDGVSKILRVMDKASLKNQRGYEILIQILALKIFDEKRSLSTTPKKHLKFFKTDPETARLKFYITKEEKGAINLGDKEIQGFINRIRDLYNEASSIYHYILKREDAETISWKHPSHIQIISEIVEQFQDYSLVKSHKTDLYQIVFYKFANEFSKAEKGQFITPIPLIDFLVKIVNPRSNEKIIDPTAGIADFLSVSYVNSKSKLDDNNIYGLDNDEQMVMLAQLNMLLNGDGNAVLKQDQTKLKKFDVVLTNPPFGEDRKYEPKTTKDKEIIEMYELWHVARSGNSIDLGLVFLENAYRILKDDGRMGIVLSNSIASIDR